MIYGIGIDIVEIERVRGLVTNYPAKVNSIFTPKELVFCKNKFSRYACIFAAKEAALKSLNCGLERGRDLLDIEIVTSPKNQFQVKLSHRLEEMAKRLSVIELKGDFSFSGDLAIAEVIAFR